MNVPAPADSQLEPSLESREVGAEIDPETVAEGEGADWYALTPLSGTAHPAIPDRGRGEQVELAAQLQGDRPLLKLALTGAFRSLT